ncbi:three-Cys-motif partner protein TcmP [Streptomyces sp. NPDC057539]|uniref:three-Cys-motif partner protein TcmP n=1 Tax=Streptomyces sp. NPDC057539 TaxID=3346159 RepID=UPI00369EE26C
MFTLDRLLKHTAVERMNLSRSRVQLVFIEKDRARHEHLVRELTGRFGPLEDLPVRVEVRRGQAGQDSERILTELGAWGNPILAVFDSWGSVNVPLDVMKRIGGNRSSEVVTTFGPNWFSRREELNPDILDMVFGGRGFWASAAEVEESDEKWRAWLATYRDALQRSGFGFRLQFQVVPRTGKPLYLVFGTGHQKGVEVMKDAMWTVDRSNGMSFSDPRCRKAITVGQGSIFDIGETVDPELLTLVGQRLRQGPSTLEELPSVATAGDLAVARTGRGQSSPGPRRRRPAHTPAGPPHSGQRDHPAVAVTIHDGCGAGEIKMAHTRVPSGIHALGVLPGTARCPCVTFPSGSQAA